VIGVEVLAQAGLDPTDRIGATAGQQEPAREAVQLVGDASFGAGAASSSASLPSSCACFSRMTSI